MQRDAVHETIRSLNALTDAQIAALTFPKEGLRVQTPLHITERYVGATKLPPGPPNGIERRSDGTYSMTRVAIVRVQPDEYRVMAAAMLKRANLQSIVIGLVCGLAVSAAAFAGMLWWQKNVNSLGRIAPAPCLVSGIKATAVNCRVGERSIQVELGKYFPDGRYILDAVDPVHRGFAATRITDGQTVVFQADPKLITPTSGVASK
jgi:hypothetical protein